MAKLAPLKPEDLFNRSYADRLILEQLTELEAVVKLSELADRLQDHGIGVGAVRSLLASNEARFAYSERRWVPATRVTADGRPVHALVHEILTNFGAPVRIELLAKEVARSQGRTEESAYGLIDRLLERDPRFVEVIDASDNASAALTEWGFNVTDEPFERGLALNQVSIEELEAVKAKVGHLNFREAGSIAAAVKLAAPVRLKVLGAAVWSFLNDFDPRSVLLYNAKDFYSQAVAVPGYVIAADGSLYPEAEAKKWVAAAVRLADKIAPTVDVEDAAPIDIKVEDVEKFVAKISASQQSITATKLLEDAYEITPGTKSFPDDMANLMTALKAQSSIRWVGGDRFQKAGLAPDWITTVPEPFEFVETDFTNEEGDLVDVELNDDGLSTTLRKLLTHPLATDVLDEEIQLAPKTMPEQVRLVLKAIHRELGTFPLSQIPTGWLFAEPSIQELIVIDPQGRELQVWVNTETRLMYNWLEWWFEQPTESGAVFTLTKTNKPNVLEFAWLDQPDPVVYISSQRMEELRTIGADADAKSTLDLLTEVMAHWPKGADYLAILAELNVVRRSSRRLVASLLSSYQCFYQRSGSPVWHFDPKKVEAGFDKTKKKFIKK